MYVDWNVVASVSTAAGTLVLAVATFSAVRSGARSARIAEQALLVGLRPLLIPTRFQDPPEKVGFADGRWFKAEGGRAIAEVGEDAVYFVVSLRNVGSGIAVLHGWFLQAERAVGDTPHANPHDFRRLTRDLWIPPGDNGFWQGALRDAAEPMFDLASRAIAARQPMTVELLYGDHEGGQRMITRFGILPHESGSWLAVVGRHWNLDRPDPR